MSEKRIVDPDTGGAKGSKLARFDMIPPDVLWELAEHYGKGEAKYESDPDGQANWQRGYSWRLSVAALHRHLNKWEQGQDIDTEIDEETGEELGTLSNHLTAVIWHAIALRWFQIHKKGKDFRLPAVPSKFKYDIDESVVIFGTDKAFIAEREEDGYGVPAYLVVTNKSNMWVTENDIKRP